MYITAIFIMVSASQYRNSLSCASFDSFEGSMDHLTEHWQSPGPGLLIAIHAIESMATRGNEVYDCTSTILNLWCCGITILNPIPSNTRAGFLDLSIYKTTINGRSHSIIIFNLNKVSLQVHNSIYEIIEMCFSPAQLITNSTYVGLIQDWSKTDFPLTFCF